MGLGVVAMGALRTAKAMNVGCGAPDCEDDHLTYDCRDVMVLTEGLTIEEAEQFGSLEEAENKRLMYRGRERVYPTILGIWFEGTCEN